VAHAFQILAGFTDRNLCRAQLAGETVALDLLATDLFTDPIDLGLDRLQLGFGFLGVALGPAGLLDREDRRGGQDYDQKERL
jgi:hypothetical protein